MAVSVEALPPLNEKQKKLAKELEGYVKHLCHVIGERNLTQAPEALEKAADYIEKQFASFGYQPQRQTFVARGKNCHNLIASGPAPEQKTSSPPIFVIGAHYDSVVGTVGANDNASGTAALLALAKRLAKFSSEHQLRFVAFVNEEPPHFQTPEMGSWVYAKACKQKKENIVAMFSLETMGYYSQKEGSQHYPHPLFKLFYPDRGNFIGFVGNFWSRRLVKSSLRLFQKYAKFPAQGAALPSFIPGIGWSDHWAFWKCGYNAVMITDTAPFRYLYYHTAEDSPDKLDYASLARVVDGLEQVIQALAKKKK